MNEDRELLEAAAEAAGLRITWGEKCMVGPDEVDCTNLPYVVSDDREESPAYWNPLEDDGDALRLANKLWLQLRHVHGAAHAGIPDAFWMTEIYGDNADTATRRAIVRAAARIAQSRGWRSPKGTVVKAQRQINKKGNWKQGEPHDDPRSI
jgi:hypothetical protein